MVLYLENVQAICPQPLFTRRQIVELTGVPEGVLGFWIKNGLLAPTQGGEGRGSHRKFSRVQVSFAAIFGQLQQFGLNIGKLKALASILQRGVDVCERTGLRPTDLQMATILAKELSRFRKGNDVYVNNPQIGSPDNYIVAISEDQIATDIIEGLKNTDTIISFAQTLDEKDFQTVDTYAVVISETDGLGIGDYSWLLWQGEDGAWYVAEQSDPSDGFREFPTTETGIYLAVGRVIRRVWGIDLEERRRHRRAAYLASLLESDPALFERLISRGHYDEDDRKLAQLFNVGRS